MGVIDPLSGWSISRFDASSIGITRSPCGWKAGRRAGLAVDRLGRAHIVWTGLNRFATSPQIDFYTGEPHDGYAQDAMYSLR